MPDTASPDGIDVTPRHEPAKMLSKRVAGVVIVIVVLLIGAFIYGSQHNNRRMKNARAETPRVEPANATELTSKIPPPAQAIQPPAPFSNDPGPIQVPPQAPQVQVYERPYPEERRPREKTAEEIAAERALQAARSPMIPAERQSPLQRTFEQQQQQPPSAPGAPQQPAELDEYQQVNLQAQKQAFIKASKAAADNYLPHTRLPQMSTYEIKAGWEIPAALEQELNSDLPGDIKALVRENVYDTATGRFLLIPQGARLLGKYNSDVAYGQESMQVVFDRIIFPDGSSINLDGMLGLDSRGNSGLHQKVDRHYKRTFGMAFLTAGFVAMYEVARGRSNPNNGGGFYYPSPGERAAGAFGGEMTNTAAQITRRNLNVQPTLRVEAGYRFNVRVGKDMMMDGPYEPITPQGKRDIQRVSR